MRHPLRNVVFVILAVLAVHSAAYAKKKDKDEDKNKDGSSSTNSAPIIPVVEQNSPQSLRWSDALKDFYDTDKKNGWDKATCRSMSGRFSSAARGDSRLEAKASIMEGVIDQRCGDDKSADDNFDSAIRKDPQLCESRVVQAVRLMERDSYGDARKILETATKADPQCTAGYTNLAMIQRRHTNPPQEKEALQNLRRALAVDANYLPAFNEMASLYLDRGRRESSHASWDLAEVVCRQAQLVNANYAPIYNTWGLVRMERGDIVEALRFFEQAIKLDPNLFEAQMNFGHVTLSFRGYQDAYDAFQKALAVKPKNYDALIALGTAARGLKRFDEAQNRYEQARDVDPKRPEAYFNMGLLYQDYMSGTVTDLRKAQGYLSDFVDRAGDNDRYRSAVDGVKRRCAPQPKKSRVRATCRPGRLQNIEQSIAALSGG